MSRFRTTLNRLDFEFTLLGSSMLIYGALIQIGHALGQIP